MEFSAAWLATGDGPQAATKSAATQAAAPTRMRQLNASRSLVAPAISRRDGIRR
jgi:hypothetical protein